MPMTNYFNPNSSKPGYEMGYEQQMDRQRYSEMANLQKMLVAMEAQKAHEDMVQDFRVRQARRDAQTAQYGLAGMLDQQRMQNPGYGPAIIGGQIGEAQSKQAAGQFDLGTVGARIPATNARARVQTLEDQARQLEYLAAVHPLEANNSYNEFYKGIPADLKHAFPPQYDPTVPKTLRKLHEITTQSPAHRRTIDQENVKGQWDVKRQESANAGALATAQARGTTKVVNYDQSLQKAATSTHVMSLAQQIQADPDIPEEKRNSLMARAKAAYEAMVKLESAKAQARNPGIRDSIDGNVGDDVARRLSGNNETQRGAYEVGKVYRGKTGNFKYKGGPVQDPRSWEKVN